MTERKCTSTKLYQIKLPKHLSATRKYSLRFYYLIMQMQQLIEIISFKHLQCSVGILLICINYSQFTKESGIGSATMPHLDIDSFWGNLIHL